MKIHPSRFEQMTAFTDVVLGIFSVFAVFQLTSFSGFKVEIWRWAFSLLGFSSLFGAVAHGFEMTENTNRKIWMPLNLSLGMALGLFVVGALFDLSGEVPARKALPIMLVVGLLFFLITIWNPGTFMTFIAYEAGAMIFALGVYSYLLLTSTAPGSAWMAAGVLTTIFAAVIQATGKAGTSMYWYFDNNGVFHFIQMAGILLLLTGVKAAL